MKQRDAGDTHIQMGQKIRLRRTELKMSQADLGEALGVSFQQIQKYEKGVNRVDSVRLELLSRVLDVPLSFFYPTGDNENTAEINSLLFTDSAFTLRLLRAYTAIPDQNVRRELVAFMETIAASHAALIALTLNPILEGQHNG